jgi:hypothetical protein
MRRAAAILLTLGSSLMALAPAPTSATSTGGEQLVWSAREDGGLDDEARAIAVSPDGTRVFVTGESHIGVRASQFATMSYDTATGDRLWSARYQGPAGGRNAATAIAVSPGGGLVFVTGRSDGFDLNPDYATVAYDAATGKKVWSVRRGPEEGEAEAVAIGTSPDGSSVFVTGWSFTYGLNPDYLTIAYQAATGERLWESRYVGPAEDDIPSALGVSPRGDLLYVTGGSVNPTTNLNYATVAYETATGAEVWVRRYAPQGLYSGATDLAVGSRRVYVTGFSTVPGTTYDYATLAHRRGDGIRLWESRYGDAEDPEIPHSIALDASSGLVFVTGEASPLGGVPDYLTLALDGPTGDLLWTATYATEGRDVARAVAVSSLFGLVYVTGESASHGQPDYATVAYGVVTGERRWVARYGTPGRPDAAVALVVSGNRVYVTGTSMGRDSLDYATVAYAAV